MEPLTGEPENRKRPIILYIIIGVLLIAIIVLSVLLGLKSKSNEEDKKEPFNPINIIFI
jgi:flagellar basal body-associated protein FliL